MKHGEKAYQYVISKLGYGSLSHHIFMSKLKLWFHVNVHTTLLFVEVMKGTTGKDL
jgi:hypothetical protein